MDRQLDEIDFLQEQVIYWANRYMDERAEDGDADGDDARRKEHWFGIATDFEEQNREARMAIADIIKFMDEKRLNNKLTDFIRAKQHLAFTDPNDPDYPPREEDNK